MKVREPSVAGMFYPESPAVLKEQINNFLANAKVGEDRTKLPVSGIIAPHAGYVYSGQTAAYAYKTISGKNYDTVVVISPSHREYFPGLSIYNGDAYKTPLGIIPVDIEKRKALVYNSRYFFEGENGHRDEHALEVHLPFLQTVINGDFKLVPIVMGDQKEGYIDELAKKLAEIYDENTLFVASSDLSHYYPASYADKLDARVEKRINNFDYEGLYKDIQRKLSEACGAGPMVAMLEALKSVGKENAEVLIRTNSGDVSQDYSEVVGYLSAIVY